MVSQPIKGSAAIKQQHSDFTASYIQWYLNSVKGSTEVKEEHSDSKHIQYSSNLVGVCVSMLTSKLLVPISWSANFASLCDKTHKADIEFVFVAEQTLEGMLWLMSSSLQGHSFIMPFDVHKARCVILQRSSITCDFGKCFYFIHSVSLVAISWITFFNNAKKFWWRNCSRTS